MVNLIIETEHCPNCDRRMPIPQDGQWRWSQSGKVYSDSETAQVAVDVINARRVGWEAIAAYDHQGRLRVATRREPDPQ